MAFFTLLALLFAYFFQPISLSAQDAQNTDHHRHFYTGITMGVVTWEVTTFIETSQPLRAGIEAEIQQTLQSVNQRMSTYIPESEVSRFNQSQSTDWIPISPETFAVVQRAQQISQASDGAFDITVQPLVDLWKFGPDKSEFSIPTEQQIETCLQFVGYQKLELQSNPPSLKKSDGRLQIDLSAIAKGYAVDQVCQTLNRMEVDNFMVNVGGEVRASGEKADNEPWLVGIETPSIGVRSAHQVIELYHQAMASSGNYRNFHEADGQQFSHTIDPRTGRPVGNTLAGASVIATDCMTADAVATAIMVLGLEKGIELAKQLNLKAQAIERVGKEMIRSQTDDFPKGLDRRDSDQSVFRVFAVASIIFALAIAAMSIGVMFGRERIKGSCGGIAALDNPDVAPECSLCSRATECSDLKKELKRRGTPDGTES